MINVINQDKCSIKLSSILTVKLKSRLWPKRWGTGPCNIVKHSTFKLSRALGLRNDESYDQSSYKYRI